MRTLIMGAAIGLAATVATGAVWLQQPSHSSDPWDHARATEYPDRTIYHHPCPCCSQVGPCLPACEHIEPEHRWWASSDIPVVVMH